MSSFSKFNFLPNRPVMLAPLAGVSDHPFRRICVLHGADLGYVEMISATALLYENQRTLEMLERHPEEKNLGVQITGRAADEVARAVEVLARKNFDTIDINMGCPVSKVVKSGCGSAILKDPERVYKTVLLAVAAAGPIPVSAKIRIGWDRQSINGIEIAKAIEAAGAAWICVHGRTRSDDYSVPVDLGVISEIKKAVNIPVIGNGNLFSELDAEKMADRSKVDGWMVSRGALGNPWIFRRMKGDHSPVSVDDWCETVSTHLRWQAEAYGGSRAAFVCMRKHLAWYLKGWAGVRPLKEKAHAILSYDDGLKLVDEVKDVLLSTGQNERTLTDSESIGNQRFSWDPKFDMDRQLDQGVGHL